MKTEKEIHEVIDSVYSNKALTFSYREDVIAVLNWVLNGEPFHGLESKEAKAQNENT